MLLGLFRVSGHSMVPIFKPNDRVIVSSIFYFFTSPKKGDIIVFKDKNSKKTLIKKIVEVKKESISVKGENLNDSLEVGSIKKSDILGKVITKI